MDDKTLKFLNETSEYLKTQKKRRNVLIGVLCAAIVGFIVAIVIGIIALPFGGVSRNPSFSTAQAIVIAIGWFTPAFYCIPAALRTAREGGEPPAPQYDLYIVSNGDIYAHESGYSQGKRAGHFLGKVFLFLVTLLLAPIICIVKMITAIVRVKNCKKEIKNVCERFKIDPQPYLTSK